MKVFRLNCPNCNAPLEIENGLDTFYCQYCGNRIILDGQSKESIRAKVRYKELDIENEQFNKQLDQERYYMEYQEKENKRSTRLGVALVVGWILLILGLLFLIKADDYLATNKMERLVDNVNQAIEEKDYDTARAEANKIHYDGDSSDSEEHWNKVRQDLLVMIEEKQAATEKRKVSKKALPRSLKDYKGEQVQDVVSSLEDAGFINVELLKASKKAGFFHKENTVSVITIDGKNDCKKGTKFPITKKIKVYYYTKD